MFYITPPSGRLPLHVLEKCVFSRLEYLDLLYNGSIDNFNGNFEYLLENSLYDKTGHFTIRLLSMASIDFLTYWLSREALLLNYRLRHISPRQLHRLFRSIIQQIKKQKIDTHLFGATMINLCSFYLQPVIFKHISSRNHAEDCSTFHCKVRFELVVDLVKERAVKLMSGFAVTHCSQWIKVLTSLFYSYIIREAQSSKYWVAQAITTDPRLNALYERVLPLVITNNCEHGRITSKNIDKEAQRFPLCMQHLHGLLRSRHRLSHYARFYYSLFLKEVGMVVDEAIAYWREEYCRPHAHNAGCTHHWCEDERKFVYGIRHLYGLEGSRKKYKPPDCRTMCMRVAGPRYEGGCPFGNFDKTILKNLLHKSLSEYETTMFLEEVSSEKSEIACMMFLKKTLKIKECKVITSPVQYYMWANTEQLIN